MRIMTGRASFRRVALAALLVLVVVGIRWLESAGDNRPRAAPSRQDVGTRDDLTPGAIERAFRNRQSGVIVTQSGRVDRVLRDDLEGTPHQRFVVELPSGTTVLIAHNVEIAPRIPDLRLGKPITFRGEYEWNPQGGVVHWTHHDPHGSRVGGWLEYQGKRYE